MNILYDFWVPVSKYLMSSLASLILGLSFKVPPLLLHKAVPHVDLLVGLTPLPHLVKLSCFRFPFFRLNAVIFKLVRSIISFRF